MIAPTAITAEDIAEWTALAEKASPAPWRLQPSMRGPTHGIASGSSRRINGVTSYEPLR